jgi:hypothetical protein
MENLRSVPKRFHQTSFHQNLKDWVSLSRMALNQTLPMEKGFPWMQAASENWIVAVVQKLGVGKVAVGWMERDGAKLGVGFRVEA